MRDGAGGQVSRQELLDQYVNWYLHRCPEVRPCRDASLLQRAAQYLQREPEPAGTFTAFPLYQALSVGSATRSTDYRRLLSGLIRAIDMLETICVNLLLQPWKKEIKTIKTFTGPFVYVLLPALSRSTIKSVLGSIGYEPNADASQREYRLGEDASPDKATLVGLELLLARVECYHLLELLEKDQLGPQEWLEVLQRRRGLSNLEESKEKTTTTTTGLKEEEKKREETDRKEAGLNAPPYLNSRLGISPQPKPRRYHLASTDQSIIEMQMTYSDLTFRGRPLLPDKPHRRSSSSRGSVVRSTDGRDDTKAAEPPKNDLTKDVKAATPAVNGMNEGEAGVSHDGDNVSTSFSTGDGDAVDGEVGNLQAVALRLTLRSESTAGSRLQLPPGTAADQQGQRVVSPAPPSPSSMEQEQELRELAERLGRLHVQEGKEEVKGEEENTSKERRRRRKGSSQREAGEPLETRPGLRSAAGRSSRSKPAPMEEEEPNDGRRRSVNE